MAPSAKMHEESVRLPAHDAVIMLMSGHVTHRSSFPLKAAAEPLTRESLLARSCNRPPVSTTTNLSQSKLRLRFFDQHPHILL